MLDYKNIDTKRGNQGLGSTSIKQLAKSVIHRTEHTEQLKTVKNGNIDRNTSIEITQIHWGPLQTCMKNMAPFISFLHPVHGERYHPQRTDK